MTHKTFFWSDTHFGHAKVLQFEPHTRNYTNINEMDAALIEAWNSVVGPDDHIYHLGDFTLNGKKEARHYLAQLNGHITVIRGSHDDRWYDFTQAHEHWIPTYYSRQKFPVACVGDRLDVSFPEISHGDRPLIIVLSHYPFYVWPVDHYGSMHLFGHVHGHVKGVGRSMDVGVDVFKKPVELHEVYELLKDQPFTIDHSHLTGK